MKVLFDLRPQHLVQIQETRVDPYRLCGLLLYAVFTFISLFNITYAAMQLSSTSAELSSLRQEAAAVSANNARIDAGLADLRALRERISHLLEFNSEELPTVEFMTALEGAVPHSLKISSIEMRPGTVLIKGSSASDGDIIDFGANLGAMKRIIVKVDAPVTTRRIQNGKLLSDFTITCGLRPFSDIASGGDDQ